MKKLLGAATLFLVCQVHAPLFAANFPKLHKLRVITVDKRPRELSKVFYKLVRNEPMEMPARMIITGKSFVRGASGGARFMLGVNLETNEIDFADWHLLINENRMGSAAIGICLFGLPGLLIASPLLFPLYTSYGVIKALTGMSVERWVVWLKLKNQLDKSERKILKEAFQKEI